MERNVNVRDSHIGILFFSSFFCCIINVMIKSQAEHLLDWVILFFIPNKNRKWEMLRIICLKWSEIPSTEFPNLNYLKSNSLNPGTKRRNTKYAMKLQNITKSIDVSELWGRFFLVVGWFWVATFTFFNVRVDALNAKKCEDKRRHKIKVALYLLSLQTQ